MPLVTPPSVVKPFAANAVAPYIQTIPVPSQIPTTPGRASYDDGFPPLTMTNPTAGGVPPFGSDMNGVLYALSAWVAWMAGGMRATFNPDVASVMGGYPIGAVLQSVSNPAVSFYNVLANNTNDPDSVTTGWVAFSPTAQPTLRQVAAPAAGTYNNFALSTGVGFLDVDTTAGDVVITGFDSSNVLDGQVIVVTNTGANLLTLNALSGGSSAPNRLRLPADLSFTLYDGMSLRYSAAVGLFVRM